MAGEGVAERVASSLVTPNFFQVLGARPFLGSGFDEPSVGAAGGRLVILSHSLWVRRYGADPAVVGSTIRVDGAPHEVVGVMDPAFRQPERSLSWQATELWVPLLIEEQKGDFGSRYLRTVGRRRSDVDLERSRAELTALYARTTADQPEGNGGRAVLVRTLDEYLMADARPTLFMLLAAGGLVLVIVCANVANLTLARGEERRREFAVRAALGAGRGRLGRQVVVEGVTLGLAGAALGSVGVGLLGGVLQGLQARYFSGLVDVTFDWRLAVSRPESR